MPQNLPEWFIKKAQAVTAKRAKTVIAHILKHGHITTEELKAQYGYDHPPRAARDVREQGIPLETFRIAGTEGKSIAGYRFADPSKIRAGTLSGRRVFSKEFKLHFLKKAARQMAILVSCLTRARIIRGSHQQRVMANNCSSIIFRHKALRRSACEGRRVGSSQGESLRSQI